MLRGLIMCELCGLTYSGVYSRIGKNKQNERKYYRCNGRHAYKKLGKPQCLNTTLRADDIEKVVLETIKKAEGSNGAVWDDIVKKCEKSGLNSDSIEEALTSLMDKGLIFEPVLGTLKTT